MDYFGVAGSTPGTERGVVETGLRGLGLEKSILDVSRVVLQAAAVGIIDRFELPLTVISVRVLVKYRFGKSLSGASIVVSSFVVQPEWLVRG